MIRTRTAPARATGTSPCFKRILAGALLGAALYGPAARADIINFENLAPTALAVGDSFVSGKLKFTTYDLEGIGNSDTLAGGIFDSTDPSSCSYDCPANNGGNYFASLPDSWLQVSSASPGGRFQLKGFDASFLGMFPDTHAYPDIPGVLMVVGYIGNSYAYRQYALDPYGPNGFELLRFNTDATFANYKFDSMEFYTYGCTSNDLGSCTLGGNNLSNFALDNLDVAYVPEPATMLTMLLGLGGMGLARRRAARAAAR